MLAPGGGSNPTEVTAEIYNAPKCSLSSTLSYSPGTLTVVSTVSTAVPSTWKAWLLYQNPKLIFSKPLPIVEPPITRSTNIPLQPVSGSLGLLMTLSSPTDGLICWDLQTVNTGTAGQTPEEVSRLAADLLR